MIEENEDHIATIFQCSQTVILLDNGISFCTEEEEEVEIENECPKGSAL